MINKTTRQIVAVFTLIVAFTIQLGAFFTPAALAQSEAFKMPQSSTGVALQLPIPQPVDVITLALLERLPNENEIKDLISKGVKSSQNVMDSSRNFFQKNLPTREELLTDLDKILEKQQVVHDFVSSQNDNLQSHLSKEQLAADLQGLVADAYKYGDSLQKITKNQLESKYGESYKVMSMILQNLTSTSLNSQSRNYVKNFLSATPGTFCKAYQDMKNGIDNSSWSAIQEGAETTLRLLQTFTSVSANGGGNLTGYAAIASTVSKLGLGGLTKTLAIVLGSNANGAAATAVVTSAVGGPLVMAGLLTAGTAATTYGTYKMSVFVAKQLGDWAEKSCAISY
ncbi:hypothetical protein NG799_15600 [Laspinema sp. D1]|uniref:Uncharacterized protein n=1 Tax=Laspinema palackyanum D2a TaxID=2953684 RepID=A0ABT2MSR1_9CYAN|nr:hypothetical protein [Laspinema sp. D2a]